MVADDTDGKIMARVFLSAYLQCRVGSPNLRVERSLRRLSSFTVVEEYAWKYWGLHKAHARIHAGTVELFEFLSLVNRTIRTGQILSERYALSRYYHPATATPFHRAYVRRGSGSASSCTPGNAGNDQGY